MTIKVHIDSMKDAEHFSNIVRRFSEEITLHAGKFCVDPKSALGVLAILYSARNNMEVDTGDMEDTVVPEFIDAISAFVVADTE